MLTVAGVVLFPLPGPGLVLLAGGLALLAERHDWAARHVEAVRSRARRGAEAGVRTPARLTATLLVTAGLGATGLLWMWGPAQPDWWRLPSWTWLPGGWWSGLAQVVSGLAALGYVVHARRRLGTHLPGTSATKDVRSTGPVLPAGRSRPGSGQGCSG